MLHRYYHTVNTLQLAVSSCIYTTVSCQWRYTVYTLQLGVSSCIYPTTSCQWRYEIMCTKGICGVSFDTLDQYPRSTPRLTLHRYLGRESVHIRPTFNRLLITCQSRLTEYRSGCPSSNNRDDYQGYQSRVSIITQTRMPLKHMIQIYTSISCHWLYTPD